MACSTTMATIRDVAKKAGVSISTVSLALNESGPVSVETKQRVWAAAEAVGYAPNALAQSLKSGRSRLIGMVVGDMANPFFGSLLRAVERIAKARDHMVIVSDTNADVDSERAILEHLKRLRVAGIIISPMGHGPEYLDQLRSIDIPMVALDQRIEGLDCDFVASDNALASAMLTEHLIRMGHRRISHISGTPGLWTTEMRIKGFRDTMASAGVEVDESLQAVGDYRGQRAYEQTMRLLTRPDRPTAIVAANNVMALGALQAIFDLGFRCPENISLTSIDDVPWSNVIRPKLTMVVQPIEELADTACRWLLERTAARGQSDLPAREELLVPSLVIGDSCAPPA